MRLLRATGASAVVVLALALPAATHAAFPGQNGKIAFGVPDGTASYIHTINPDGTGETLLRQGRQPAWSPSGQELAFRANGELWKAPAAGGDATKLATGGFLPTWSPDGANVAFANSYSSCHDCGVQYSIAIARADGTGVRFLTYNGSDPTWSPDGSEIAFRQLSSTDITTPPQEPGLWAIRPDGTGLRRIVPYTVLYPDWSPDGTKIVFSGAANDTDQGIWVVNAAGGTPVRIYDDGRYPFAPVWSPDGMKIAFTSSLGITLMNADGSNPTLLTSGSFPDWQPIPINTYPRPKGASPVELSLVPAYQQCTTPNRTHGPPLAFGSCAPPQRTPGQLTVGTADSNGTPTKSVSIVRIGVLAGNASTPADEADLRLYGTVNDVRLASDLSDYSGQLESRVNVRITDKDNTPHPGGPGAATVRDITYTFPIQCVATPDTTVGGDCTFDTTAEALVPGLVKELRRSVWELGAMRVYDSAGGLFMTQGIFVP